MYTEKKRSIFIKKNSFPTLCLGAILTILVGSRWSEEFFPRLEYFFKRALFPEPSDTYYSLYLFPLYLFPKPLFLKPLRLPLGRVLQQLAEDSEIITNKGDIAETLNCFFVDQQKNLTSQIGLNNDSSTGARPPPPSPLSQVSGTFNIPQICKDKVVNLLLSIPV